VGELGRLVRRKAAYAMNHAPTEACLFVNLHTEELLDPSLLAGDSPLTQVANRVILEITERASIEDVADLNTRIARLRELGYRIALDDMGAGYANLNAFALLEPEVIKLDMSLVRGLPHSKTKQKLVRSIVSLCRDMDTLIVGEGVETPEERDALIALGCDLLQGFLFSPPHKTLPRNG
jgi:EAL domain-containing protein (putative c-di-GMP-specific phosphodiesterase class I)